MKYKNIKTGFSLIEVMLLFTILSVILAASIPLISKRSRPIPEKIPHGVYRCIAKPDGNFLEELYSSARKLDTHTYTTTTACSFKVPKASVYKIDLYSAGAGGTKRAVVSANPPVGNFDTVYRMDGTTGEGSVPPIKEPTSEELKAYFLGAKVMSSIRTGGAGSGQNVIMEYRNPKDLECSYRVNAQTMYARTLQNYREAYENKLNELLAGAANALKYLELKKKYNRGTKYATSKKALVSLIKVDLRDYAAALDKYNAYINYKDNPDPENPVSAPTDEDLKKIKSFYDVYETICSNNVEGESFITESTLKIKGWYNNHKGDQSNIYSDNFYSDIYEKDENYTRTDTDTAFNYMLSFVRQLEITLPDKQDWTEIATKLKPGQVDDQYKEIIDHFSKVKDDASDFINKIYNKHQSYTSEYSNEADIIEKEGEVSTEVANYIANNSETSLQTEYTKALTAAKLDDNGNPTSEADSDLKALYNRYKSFRDMGVGGDYPELWTKYTERISATDSYYAGTDEDGYSLDNGQMMDIGNSYVDGNTYKQMEDLCRAIYYEASIDSNSGWDGNNILTLKGESVNQNTGLRQKNASGGYGGYGVSYMRITFPIKFISRPNYYDNEDFKTYLKSLVRPITVNGESVKKYTYYPISVKETSGVYEEINSAGINGLLQSLGPDYFTELSKSDHESKTVNYLIADNDTFVDSVAHAYGNTRQIRGKKGSDMDRIAMWHVPEDAVPSGSQPYVSLLTDLPTGGKGGNIKVDIKYYTPDNEGKTYQNVNFTPTMTVDDRINAVLNQGYFWYRVGSKTNPELGTNAQTMNNLTSSYTASKPGYKLEMVSGDGAIITKIPELHLKSNIWTKTYKLAGAGTKGTESKYVSTNLGSRCTFTVPKGGPILDLTDVPSDTYNDLKEQYEERLKVKITCVDKNGNTVFEQEKAGGEYKIEPSYIPKNADGDELHFIWNGQSSLTLDGEKVNNATWLPSSLWAKIFKTLMFTEDNRYDLNKYHVGFAGKGVTLVDNCTVPKGSYTPSILYNIRKINSSVDGGFEDYTQVSDANNSINLQPQEVKGIKDDLYNCYGTDPSVTNQTSQVTFELNGYEDNHVGNMLENNIYQLSSEDEMKGGGGAVVITW